MQVPQPEDEVKFSSTHFYMEP